MTRRPVVVLAAVAVLVALWPWAPAGAAARARRVVVVSIPSITWEDVRPGVMPALDGLAKRWSIAAMSVRTVHSRTDLPAAYASLGAGNRARGVGNPDERIVPETVRAPGGALRVDAMADIRVDNDRLRFGAVPGTLGSTLRGAGLRTAVVGNADGGRLPRWSTVRRGAELERRRWAGLALADLEGRIDHGSVGDGLVLPDAATLNGYRSDPDAMIEAVRGSLARSDVVLVEVADTHREGRIAYGRLSDREILALADDDPSRVAALRRDDALLERVVREVDLSRDTLMVLAPSGLGTTRRERLTVALMAGVGATREGWLTSPTTRREGIVALTDVGPGILRLLGLPQPAAMTGQPLRAMPGTGEDRRDHLFRVQSAALFHSRWVSEFFVFGVLCQVALYLFAWIRLPWGVRSVQPAGRLSERPARSRAGAVRALALGFMALPLGTLAVTTFDAHLWGTWGPGTVIASTVALITALALLGPWRRAPSGPPAFVCALTAVVVMVDLLTGSRVQMSSLVGYSPIVAGRFFGVGNLVFALFGTSAALVGAALAARVRRGGIALVAALGLAVVVAEGAPMFGADFGGVLALVPAFGLLVLLVSGRRVSWGQVALLAALTLGGAALVGFVDSLRPPEVQTHIGRFFTRLIEGGPSAVSQIVARKAAANWTVLVHSVLTLSVPIAAAFVLLVLMRPAGRLRRALDEEPGLKWGLQAAALVNLLGFAVNDSGIAITAMGVALAVPYCLATVLGLTDDPPVAPAGRTAVRQAL